MYLTIESESYNDFRECILYLQKLGIPLVWDGVCCSTVQLPKDLPNSPNILITVVKTENDFRLHLFYKRFLQSILKFTINHKRQIII